MSLPSQRPEGLCRLCGASVDQERIGRERMLESGQWLVSCGCCGGAYLEPDMEPEALERFYREDYRRLFPFEACAVPGEAFLRATRVREIGWRRAGAVAALLSTGGRVLELGSGHGGFLGALARLRPDAVLHAVEPDAARRALALGGAAVRFCAWNELAAAAPFDLIAAFHVLEHLRDPVGDLRRLGRLLAPGGRLVAEVPAGVHAAMGWREVHPAHLSYFTSASLERVCRAAGLEPSSSSSASARLPGCLWLEAVPGAAQPLALRAAESEVTDMRGQLERAHAGQPGRFPRMIGRLARLALGPDALGMLSRWRNVPVLDDLLAEPGGRLFRLGIAYDPVTMAEVLGRAEAAMETRTPYRIADVNVAKLMGMRTDGEFRMAVLSSDCVTLDGMGVVWAAAWLGAKVPERVTGIDLLMRMMGLCEKRGFRPFIVGARADVLERAVAHLKRRFPALDMAGWHHGYWAPEGEAAVVELVARSGADCLVVALPYPRQDLFLRRVHAASGAAVAFGVGGSMDVLSGDRRRAPPWVQRCGMEWFYRLMQEPLRLGPRYVTSNARFLGVVLAELAARRLFAR